MLIVWTDASVSGHHGAGIGWHIQTHREDRTDLLTTVDSGYDALNGNYTSEEGEMLAITRGVKEVLEHDEQSELTIYSDCKPLVEKIASNTPVADDREYMDSLYCLLAFFDSWDIEYKSRSKNTYADRLAHCGLDQARDQYS